MSPILEPERSELVKQAVADAQLQAVRTRLEQRGLTANTEEAQAIRLAGGEQVLIPFGPNAHLVWTRTNGQTAALCLIRQGNKTLNVTASGEERTVKLLSAEKIQRFLQKLRQKTRFQQFEERLRQRGKRLAEGRLRVLVDETRGLAILGLTSDEDGEKIAHQMRIKLKANKDDEPEDTAEPVIQATACGQATGEAVATAAELRMQPLVIPDGGEVGGGYEGPQICTTLQS